MKPFGARDILTELGLFAFSIEANGALSKFAEDFRSANPFENSFRTNLAAIASCEFAVIRRVLNGEFQLGFRLEVGEPDVHVALLLSDTLRTRPCKTAQAASQGNISPGDVFAFSGDASKASYRMQESGKKLQSMSVDDVAGMALAMYHDDMDWHLRNAWGLANSGLGNYLVVFAVLRFATLRDLGEGDALQGLALVIPSPLV